MALLPAACLEAVMAEVMALLHDRASSQDGLDLLLAVYRARRTDVEELHALLLNGSLPMPQVEVLASGAMAGALGAYSPIGTTGTATIYLADSLLLETTPDDVRLRVLLEEIGHHLDHLLHGDHDSPGDEGELFARLVLGEELTPEQIDAIQQADDTGLVSVHGVLVAVEQAALVGDSTPNTLTGTGAADTFTGNGGLDTYMVASGGTPLSFSGSGANGSVSGYDTITDYQPPSSVGGSGEVIGYATTTATVVANGQGSGTASTLLLRNNKPIRSYAVSNGIIRFDSSPTYKTERPIGSIGELAAAAQFLINKDLGNHGAVVTFRATLSGVDQSFVWIQGHDNASTNNSVLIALPGVTATAASASGNAISIVDGLAPATTASITSVIDDLGSTTGTVPSGGSTDDTALVLNGSLSAPLGPGEALRVFDGTSDLGGATTSGTSWTFSDPRSLNGGQSVAYRVRVADSAGNLGALSTTYSVIITSQPPPDTTAPTISSVAISAATGAQNGILNAGDLLTIAVLMSEPVNVTGSPLLNLLIGTTTVQASYSSGTGSSTLLFTTTIQAGQNDADGISIPADAIGLNGGTIRDGAGNNADLSHAAVAANAAFLVDTSAPAAPVLALQSGSGTVSVSGLEAGATWRYSSTGGAGWSVDQPASTSSFTLSPGTYTAGQVQVIQTDRAGNSSAAGLNAATYTVSGSTSPGASFSFSSFSGATGLQLNGNASLAGSLQLTPVQGNQRGSAFYAIPLTIQAETSFSSQFQIAITGGSSGADGLTFVIQNTGTGSAALGGSGSGLGYGSGDENVPAIDRSLAIEIDTYQNSWDIDSNHVAVLQGGNVQTHLAQKQLSFDANSGTPFNVWLDYLGGSTDSLKVFLSTSATKPTTADLQLSSIDLPTILGNQAYVGFTAGTGGLSNAHAVNSWSFSSSSTQAPPDTTAPRISSVAISAATGAQNGILNAGDLLTIAVVMNEVVSVTGLPQLALTIGSSPVLASYSSGTGSSTLLFTTTIQAGQNDADGISIPIDAIGLNGGTIRDGAGNNADLSHAAVAANAAFLVDTTTPAPPTLTLQDGSATVNVGGLESSASWSYSTNGAATWSSPLSASTTSFSLPVGSYAPGTILARQVDLAGNTSPNGQNGTTFTVSGTSTPGTGSGTGFSYANGFSGATGLQSNGSTTQAATLQLTPNASNLAGSAFHTTALPFNADTSFSTQFQFAIAGGAGGADGFTFILQNSTAAAAALAGNGGGLGYGFDTGTAGIANSIAIEFDTYQNSWDSNANHVALLSNGNVQTHLSQKPLSFDLNSGSPINVWIDYLGATNELKVFVSPTATKPLDYDLLYNLDLPAILGDKAFAGFAAGTGGLTNAHTINSWSFSINSPLFQFKSNSLNYVSESQGQAVLQVQRTGSSDSAASLQYTTNAIGPATQAGAAQPGADYSQPSAAGLPANTGMIEFSINQSEQSFFIPLINDTIQEGNEEFSAALQSPSIGGLGAPRTARIRVIDDDGAPRFALSESNYTIQENGGLLSVIVLRSGDFSQAASVTVSASSGSAEAGSDFGAFSNGTFSTLAFFPVGSFVQKIDMPITNDSGFEATESFQINLSNPSAGSSIDGIASSQVTILDDDSNFNNLVRQTFLSGLSAPTTMEWLPDGRMLVAEKSGLLKLVVNGVVTGTPIDLRAVVNDVRDRGLLGLALHPQFSATNPYLYVAYTYDPPETAGRTGLGGPDGSGNRPNRVEKLTVDPTTLALKNREVILGRNSTWAFTSNPTQNSTGSINIPPSGIVGSWIAAPSTGQFETGVQDNYPSDGDVTTSLASGNQNQSIRDYLATDSESHSIGDLEFGLDGMLYVSNGDGTSYNFMDPRTVRVQDVDNLSGKVLRIDPTTGLGVAGNPFFEAADPNSNQSKVYYLGLRNPFRFSVDPVTGRPVVGDVGWNTWEEINTGQAGSNFGWPYFEGPNQAGGYSSLGQAGAFYGAGNRVPESPSTQSALEPIAALNHTSDGFSAIMVGDFINQNTFVYGDISSGKMFGATLDANRKVSSISQFDSTAPFVVDVRVGPDGLLYGASLYGNSIVRWV